MSSSCEEKRDFTFGLDEPIDSVTFLRTMRISGWLVDTSGRSVHGIRSVQRTRRHRERATRARRKFHRHDIAAQFPALPEAFTSGFVVQLKLRLGRNEIALQVEDAPRRWKTFYQTKIDLLPFGLVASVGLPNTSALLAARLRAARQPPAPTATIPYGEADSADDEMALAGKEIVIYATSRSNLFIRDVGHLVAAGFKELNCDAHVVFDEIPKLKRPDLLQIILTPHEYYNLFLLDRVSRQQARRLTRETVFLCTEQPRTGWFDQNLRWAYGARAVADINRLGVEAYRNHQIPSVHLPLGFHEILETESSRPTNRRHLDIFFFGSLTVRREKFFAKHAEFFSERECHLRFVPLGFAKTEISRSYLSVARRNALLADAKILLNIHYSNQAYFEWHRMLLGLANGCCIITEECAGYAPLVPNQHFVMVEHDDLIDACRYYLEFPQEREAIADAGYEFVRAQLRQSSGCRNLLRFLGEQERKKPAAAPIDPRARPLPRILSKKIAGNRSVWSALRRDLRGEKAPAMENDTKGLSPSMEQITRARQKVVAKRAGYQARRKEQERQRSGGAAPWTIEGNAHLRGANQPQLSILITLYNYADYIERCLRAVDRACAELTIDSEIVIVEDHSTDASLARARRFARSLARPVRLVRKHFNTGLADARNIGLELSRAPYVFILDADNLLMPRALAILYDAIRRGSHAAAYSILCRFGQTPHRPAGLLSHYDWDPEILVQGPYVDAMAMFNRQTLLDFGGYDHTLSEIGWFGWEDYDMWLRFAQADLPVAFVPNILCLYRQHGASMINSTNLFTVELVELLHQRYHFLAEKFPVREEIFGIERTKLAAARARSTHRSSTAALI